MTIQDNKQETISKKLPNYKENILATIRDDLLKYHISIPDDIDTMNIKQLCEYFDKNEIDPFNVKKRISAKKVLSVELSLGHDIIRPSIYYYFNKLGYEVDFLLAEVFDINRYNFFENIDTSKINTITGSYGLLHTILGSKSIREYDYIIFNTSVVIDDNHPLWTQFSIEACVELTGLMPMPKYGLLHIPPHVTGLPESIYSTHKFNDIAIVNHLGYQGLPMLSVQYFGDVNITEKSEKTIFLAIGALAGRHNHAMLFPAAQKLIDEGLTNFEIWVNAGGHFEIPKSFAANIKFIGENRPKELFEYIERSDFILSCLDSKDSWADYWQKNFYGAGTCSSSFMSSLAFRKPYVLDDYFTHSLGLKQQQCISYTDDLYTALKQALLMSKEEYANMQNEISLEAQRREQQSLADISKVLKIIKNEKSIFNYFKLLIEYQRVRLLAKITQDSNKLRYKKKKKFLKEKVKNFKIQRQYFKGLDNDER